MNYYFASNLNFLKLKIGIGSIDLPEKLGKEINLGKYNLIKNLTPVESKQINRVGIFADKARSKKIVLKKHKFFKVDEDVIFTLNEASFLLLNNSEKIFSKKSNISLPELAGLNINKNEVTIASKFVPGKMIFNLTPDKFVEIIEIILKQLRNPEGNADLRSLPLMKKTPIYFLLYTIYDFFRLILIDYRGTVNYLLLVAKFYFYYLLSFPFFNKLSICHGELFQDSILFDKKNKQIYLVDWESVCLSDQFFDLALVSRYYFDVFDNKVVSQILRSSIKNSFSLYRFKALGIFAAIEYFLNRPVSRKSKKQLMKYAAYVSNFDTH